MTAATLAGLRVLVPRAAGQAGELAARLRALGATSLEAPVLHVVAGDAAAVRRGVRELLDGRFVAVALTSSNGVAALRAGLDAEDVRPDTLLAAVTRPPGVLVGVVGSGTARATRELLGIAPTLRPERSTGAALGDAFPAGEGEVLLPRGDLASSALPDALRAKGYAPVEVTAYRTVLAPSLPDEVRSALAGGAVDLVLVTSPSVVRALVGELGPGPWPTRVVSIGPVTSAACAALGLPVAAEADPHDLDGLVDAAARAARGPA